MKYLIILYVEFNDDKPSKKSIYEADNYSSAVATFHGHMNAYMKDATVKHVLCTVNDVNGNPKKTEYWDRPEEVI